MQAVTEISNGIDEPSSCGMSTVMALPPTWACASNSRKSNRSGCWCRAQATPSPETPPPTMATLLGVAACLASRMALNLPPPLDGLFDRSERHSPREMVELLNQSCEAINACELQCPLSPCPTRTDHGEGRTSRHSRGRKSIFCRVPAANATSRVSSPANRTLVTRWNRWPSEDSPLATP